MGAGQSLSDIGGSTYGYHVLRVQPNSPGSRAGLQSYFDFILAAGNTRFDKENGAIKEILKASIDQRLKMLVYNTRTKKTREVDIIPSTTWGGNGLLGVSIKHNSFDKIDEKVWHVLEVQPGSPAQQAGLLSNDDYVIGSDSTLQESEDLYNLIQAHDGKPLKLFTYNVVTDSCREVICTPNSGWGGEGSLGCEFGHGYLHRIPYREKDEEKRSLLSGDHLHVSGQTRTHNIIQEAGLTRYVNPYQQGQDTSASMVTQVNPNSIQSMPYQTDKYTPQQPGMLQEIGISSSEKQQISHQQFADQQSSRHQQTYQHPGQQLLHSQLQQLQHPIQPQPQLQQQPQSQQLQQPQQLQSHQQPQQQLQSHQQPQQPPQQQLQSQSQPQQPQQPFQLPHQHQSFQPVYQQQEQQSQQFQHQHPSTFESLANLPLSPQQPFHLLDQQQQAQHLPQHNSQKNQQQQQHQQQPFKPAYQQLQQEQQPQQLQYQYPSTFESLANLPSPISPQQWLEQQNLVDSYVQGAQEQTSDLPHAQETESINLKQ